MANEKKYLDFNTLSYYDDKLKKWVSAADETVLADAKEYADGLATNYDAAGTAQTAVDALANGAVADNTAAIAKLNGDASTDGSVAKAVATLNAAIEAVEDKADAAQGDVDALEKTHAADKLAIEASIGAAQTAFDTLNASVGAVPEGKTVVGMVEAAQADADALELDMGDVDGLSTENKTVVGAINEVLAAVGTGGTAAVVTMTTNTTSDGALKSYTIKQGDTTVGVIDIPKDMVVESGEVVTNPEGQTEGTYIKLVLANVAEPLYINVGTLVDIYKAKADAAQVQIAIDSATREISATIVAGSVTSTELADNAVVTAKIADANVTKAKLSTAVQASLDKADVAEGNAKDYADGLNTAMDERMADVEALLGTGEGSVATQIATAKQEAIDAAATDATTKAGDAEKNAKDYADGLNTSMNTRVEALEAIDHEHANMDVLNGITAEKVAAWDAAEADALADAKEYADGLNTAMNTRMEAVETKSATNETNIGLHADRLDALEGKVGEGFVAITNAEIDTLFPSAE